MSNNVGSVPDAKIKQAYYCKPRKLHILLGYASMCDAQKQSQRGDSMMI